MANEGVTRFGSAESSFKINKPLMLEPSLPRFANVGDGVMLKAVVHNTTQFSGEIEANLKLDDHLESNDLAAGETSKAKPTKSFTVAAGQSNLLFPRASRRLATRYLNGAPKPKLDLLN